jgi:hypothetical protein
MLLNNKKKLIELKKKIKTTLKGVEKILLSTLQFTRKQTTIDCHNNLSFFFVFLLQSCRPKLIII